MAKKRTKELLMDKIREVLRLALQCKRSNRETGKTCRISHSTVRDYIIRVNQAGLTYEQIKNMDDQSLHDALKRSTSPAAKPIYPMPDWEYVHQELKKKSVTLQLLWEEYKAVYPDGYQSTQFAEHYRKWKKKLNTSMRQTHKGGEKMFVDYAGQTVPVRDHHSGKIQNAEIFVAVLGASNYTYAEASWTQGLECWINSHIHAYEYFNGVTNATVVDNLKSGVSKTCRYEPNINLTYQDMAAHYGTVILPARVRKPKDKAKVEVGVQIVERWILARLRNQIFFSIHELNVAIKRLLVDLNQRPFKKLEGSRQSVFEAIEHPALQPLPENPYVFAQWKKARVNIDYHVELNRHYYSVPYELSQKEVFIRYTQNTLEVFFNNKRVASYLRDDSPGRHSTVKEHMPKSHQQYLEWSPSRIINWAKTMGESTAKIVEIILNTRRHPEQGYRSCMGLLRLAKRYSQERLESACRRALIIGGYSYKSVCSILEKGLDQQPLPESNKTPTIKHENIRGKNYF